MGWGLVILIMSPFLGGLLVLTLVGASLGILVFVAYGIAIFFAPIWPSLWVGKAVSERLGRKEGWMTALILGVLILGFIRWLPIVGGLVGLVSILAGLGTMFLVKRKTYDLLRKKDVM